MVGRWVRVSLYVACSAALGWLALVLARGGWEAADPVASVIGATVGVGALLMAWWTAFARDPEAVAERLAHHVTRVEAERYVQLLGGDLGGRIDVTFDAETFGEVDGAAATGRLTDITHFYRDLRPGRVVIADAARSADDSGGAGSGKTLAAVTLLLGLAEERSAGTPVPLWLTAPSWPGGSVEDWLRRELTTVWRVPGRAAERLLEARLVLPVIDGLDELDSTPVPGHASRAAALLRMVNAYQHALHRAPVVMTCRGHAYDALMDADSHLRNAVVLRLNPVTASQAQRFLEHRVADGPAGQARWQAVLDALEPRPSDEEGRGEPSSSDLDAPSRRRWSVLLRRRSTRSGPARGTAGPIPLPRRPSAAPALHPLPRALDTPWRLTLVATVYQERSRDGEYRRDPAALLDLARAGTLRRHLLDRYVAAALAAPAHHRAFRRRAMDPDRTWRHLAVLARYLNGNLGSPPGGGTALGPVAPSTDLVLHELWPLAGTRRPRLVHLALALIYATFGTAVVVAASGSGALWRGLLCAVIFYMPVAWALSPSLVPMRVSLHALRSWRAVGWTMLSLTVGIVSARSTDDALHAAAVMGAGLLAGLVAGTTAPKYEPPRTPQQTLRGNVAAMLVTFVGVGATSSIFAWGIRSEQPLHLVATAWFAAGFVLALSLGLVTPAGRYFAFLLSTRGQLPWRLSRFLRRCHRTGLLRTAGLAYQFRHRELQAHLARHPQPPLRE